MILDAKAIYKIADLARIHIEEKDVDTLIPEMNKILSFMEKLNELDTTNVKPLVYKFPPLAWLQCCARFF